MKTCTKCGEMKPLSEFYKDKHSKDGLTSWCKACAREYRIANREKRRICGRKYYAAEVCANAAKRRALEAKVTVGDLTAQRIYDLVQNGTRVRCYLCGKLIPSRKAGCIRHRIWRWRV